MSSSLKAYKSSKMIRALQSLLMGKALVSVDKNGSNYNQYFSKMKNKYHIKLDEVSKPNINNPQNHLERRLIFDNDNIERVESVLIKLGGKIPSRINESQKR